MKGRGLVSGVERRAWTPGRILCLSGALVMFLTLLTGGSESAATCPSKTEQRYTPNETAIKAEVAKLSGFENDMRAALADLKTLQTDDADNRFWGKVTVWRTIGGEAGRGICTGVSVVNETLAQTTCERAKDVADLINGIKKCGEGEAVGCVEVGVNAVKKRVAKQQKKIDRKVKELGGEEKGARTDPRYHWNEELQEAKKSAASTELKGKALEGVQKGTAVSKGGVDALTEACKSGIVPSLGLMPGGSKAAGISGVNKGCDVVGNLAAIGEAYEAGEELEEASQQNQARLTKLTQQLEEKIAAVSRKIVQLRGEVYAVNWAAMGKPEPNMTPIKQDGCEGENLTEEEIQQALAQLRKPTMLSFPAPPDSGEPVEASSSFLDANTLGALLQGTMQALSGLAAERAAKQEELQRSQREVVPQKFKYDGCFAEKVRAGRSPFECNKAAPDPVVDPLLGGGSTGSSSSQSSSVGQPSQKRPPAGGGTGERIPFR